MTSTNESTRISSTRRHEICCLLEEHLIANFETLSVATNYPQTLLVTEDRQFRNRGLSHIEDCAYEFFLETEVVRVNYVSEQQLSLHRDNLVNHTECEVGKFVSIKK